MIQMAYLLESLIDFFEWGCIQAEVVLFQYHFLTGVVLVFEGGVLTARIRYAICVFVRDITHFFSEL